MDEVLKAIMNAHGKQHEMLLDESAGTLQLSENGQGIGEVYAIKPLPQLYGRGTGVDSVEFTDDRFMALLMSIERTLVNAYSDHPSLTDGLVLAALERLCLSPEADARPDPLAASVQFQLRVTCSMNDYSRQDVRHALRKVKQSVARHNKLAGTRGYLNFITQTISGV